MQNRKLILVITLGNKDIQIDERNFKKITNVLLLKDMFIKLNGKYLINKNNFRESTERILEKEIFDNIKGSIELPIIFPFLEKFRDYSKIFLLSTDQQDKNKTDTVYSAEIIKRYLEEKGFSSIEILKITHNPTDIKENLEFIIREVGYLLKEENSHISFLASSGTPQLKEAIMLFKIFKKNVRIYEASNGEVYEKNSEYLEKYILYSKILDALNSSNYNLINNFKEFLGEDFLEKFNELYKYYLFTELPKDPDLIRDYQEKLNLLLSHIFDRINAREGNVVVGEIYVLFQNMIYLLFLRLSKKLELIEGGELKYLGESGEKKDKIKKVMRNCFVEWMRLIFKRLEINEEALLDEKDIKITASGKFLKKFNELTSEIETENIDRNRFLRLEELYDKIEKILSLRNRTILAHDLRGFTLREILEEADFISENELKNFLIKHFENIVGVGFRDVFFEKKEELKKILKEDIMK